MGKSFLRVVLIAAVTALAVIGGIALTVPMLVSTDTARAAIERELSAFFGTSARLDGATEIRLWPRPQAFLEDVTIASAVPGAPPLLTAETIIVDIRRGSTLFGAPAFSGYRLVRPHLQLTRNAGGQIDRSILNGQFGEMVNALTRAGRPEDAAADAGRPVDQPDAPERLGPLSVDNGTMTIAGPPGEPAETVSSINLVLNWPAFDAPASLSGDMIWRGAQAELQLRIGAPDRLPLDRGSPLTFNVRSEAGSLSFDGLASFAQPMFWEGELALQMPSLKAVTALLRTDAPTGRTLGAFSLSGPVQLAQHRLRFDGATVDLDGNVGTGVLEFALRPGKPRPAITGTLDFSSLDLSMFVTAFSDFFDPVQPGMNMPGQESGRPDTDFRLSAATATFGELELGALAATVQVSENVALFDVGDAMAYGGHIQARLTVDPNQAGRHREIMLSGQDVDTGLIGAEFGLPELLPRGRGKFSLSVTGPANGWHNLLTTADGYVSLEMTDGVLPALDVDTLFGWDDQARYFPLETGRAGERFTRAMINGDIRDGVVTLRKGIVTYPDGMLDLTGIVSLAGGSLALTATGWHGTADEAGTVPADALASYFIGGSWNRPFATPVSPSVPPAGGNARR